MSGRRVHLTFPSSLIQEPVLHTFATKFNVVPNIRRANVEDTFGWVILEVGGDDDAIDEGLAYLRDLGVEVNEITGDIVEG